VQLKCTWFRISPYVNSCGCFLCHRSRGIEFVDCRHELLAVENTLNFLSFKCNSCYHIIIIIIIIIIIERKDLGGVMSKDCRDTLRTLKQWQNASATQSENRVSVRCDRGQSCRDQENLDLDIFNWRLKDASEDNDVRDLDKLFLVLAAAMGKARSPAVERRMILQRFSWAGSLEMYVMLLLKVMMRC